MKKRSAGADAREVIFKFIVRHKKAHDGNSPSSREIMKECGISSTSVVHYHLAVMEREGTIRLWKGKTRLIEVVGGDWKWHEEYIQPHP
jgi:SOS-response transcriptional repressor LexA